MEPIVLGNSRRRYALLLAMSALFTAAGVFLLFRIPPGGDRWKAWFTTLFFGACLAVFLFQVFDPRPRLVLDDSGIYDRTLSIGRIPWPEILDARLRSIRGNAFICLTLRDPNLWLHNLSPLQRKLVKANRALGFSELNLNLSGVAADPAQILALILKLSAAARGNRPR